MLGNVPGGMGDISLQGTIHIPGYLSPLPRGKTGP